MTEAATTKAASTEAAGPPDLISETPLTKFMTRIADIHFQMHQPEIDVHSYVLRRGRRFTSKPLTKQEKEYINTYNWHRHQKKQCYMNAQMTALIMPSQDDMTLLYAEGFLGIRNMEYGIHHAWLSLNGKVVDTTLRTNPNSRRVMGTIPGEYEYYGVEMDPEICIHSVEHKTWTPIIDDWECGWPLLTKDETWIKETQERIRQKFKTESEKE